MRVNKLVVFCAIAATVILINLPVPASLRVRARFKDDMAPFQNVLGWVVNVVQNAAGSLVKSRDVNAQRDELQAEVGRLRYRIGELNALQKENEELRKSQDFALRSKWKLTLCRVISRDETSGWWRTIRLNKGSDAGIRPDMPVVTAEGLVGRVSAVVSHNTCDVLLVTDPTCKAACQMPRSGGLGIARGGGVSVFGKDKIEMLCPNPGSRLDFVPKDRRPFEGDEIVTSGLGGIFPQGLPVGRVRKAEMDRSGLYWRAIVEPAANLDRLEYVFVVVTPEGRTRE